MVSSYLNTYQKASFGFQNLNLWLKAIEQALADVGRKAIIRGSQVAQ
jgi:hypothetical protein